MHLTRKNKNKMKNLFFFIIILLFISNSLLNTIPTKYIKKFESINSQVKQQLYIKKINSSSYFFGDGSSDFIYDIFSNKIDYLKPNICLNKTNCPYINIKNNKIEYSIFQYGNNLQIINLSNNKTIYSDIVIFPFKSICKYNENEFIYIGGENIQNYLYKISYSGNVNFKLYIPMINICYSTKNNLILYFSLQNQNFFVYYLNENMKNMILIYSTYSNLKDSDTFHILEMENNILIICFLVKEGSLSSNNITCIKGEYKINNNEIQFNTDFKSKDIMFDCTYDDFNLIYYNPTTFLISCGVKNLKISKANYDLQIIDSLQIENNEFDYIKFTSLGNNQINFIMSYQNNHYYYNYYVPKCENKTIYLKFNEKKDLKNLLFDNYIDSFFLKQIKFTYLEDNHYIKLKNNDNKITSKNIYKIDDLYFNSEKKNIRIFSRFVLMKEEPNLFKTDLSQSNQCTLDFIICYENCEKCTNIGDRNQNNCKKCIQNYALMENTNNCYNINDTIPNYVYSKKKDLFVYVTITPKELLNKLKNINNYSEIFDLIKYNVKNNHLNNFLFSSNNFTIEVFEYKNNEANFYSTNINLNKCENILKEKYNINKDEDLIIMKSNFINEEYHTIKFSFLIYSQLGEELNLSLCNNNITIKTQITFSLNNEMINAIEKGHDIFNSSSNFYNDICLNFKSIKGRDININDRKKQFYKNYELCPSNCEYVKFDLNEKKIECNCLNANFEKLNEESFIINKIENDFDNKYSWSNLKVLKCLNKNKGRGFKKFLALLNFFLLLITIMLFILHIFILKIIKSEK